MHIIVRLPVKQPSYIVFVCEPLKVVELVLKHALVQAPAEADVESAGKTAHDIDAVIAAIASHAGILVFDYVRGCADAHNL
jgi:hypothetical protein